MSNPDHVAIVRKGVEAWNRWRDEDRSEITADLSGESFHGQKLIGIRFRINMFMADIYSLVNLKNTDFTDAYLTLADFTHAIMTDADLAGARLYHADFSDAYLYGANLSNAYLGDATFKGTDLKNARFDNAEIGNTKFIGVDLSNVSGLESVRHKSGSLVDFTTLFISKGRIPEAFLRGVGFPDTLIEFTKSLTGKAFEFYSCFISYTTKDQSFVERLHNDLQANGVRVWFAPQDLKIGDKFRSRIDTAIQLYDKLLIVLSENSLASAWVEKEVETAFEKENTQNRIALFPIRLDDAVMQTSQSWAADIRRTRHIGDFRNWKDADSYKQALTRLLKDLKTETSQLKE